MPIPPDSQPDPLRWLVAFMLPEALQTQAEAVIADLSDRYGTRTAYAPPTSRCDWLCQASENRPSNISPTRSATSKRRWPKFQEMWAELQQREFAGEFVAEGLMLLRYENRRWHLHRDFPLGRGTVDPSDRH